MDRQCDSDKQLFQIAAIEFALFYRYLPSVDAWEVPDEVKRVERYLDRPGMRPLHVMAIFEERDR